MPARCPLRGFGFLSEQVLTHRLQKESKPTNAELSFPSKGTFQQTPRSGSLPFPGAGGGGGDLVEGRAPAWHTKISRFNSQLLQDLQQPEMDSSVLSNLGELITGNFRLEETRDYEYKM